MQWSLFLFRNWVWSSVSCDWDTHVLVGVEPSVIDTLLRLYYLLVHWVIFWIRILMMVMTSLRCHVRDRPTVRVKWIYELCSYLSCLLTFFIMHHELPVTFEGFLAIGTLVSRPIKKKDYHIKKRFETYLMRPPTRSCFLLSWWNFSSVIGNL